MALSRYKLGQLIELTTETNKNNSFGVNDVKGMTITKQIIPTKANVSTADLEKFLVIHPTEFVFNPRTHGKHIGFGYNSTGKSFIISWNNIGFRVKKEVKEVVSPEYLFLHFNRVEWDREACFRSWGSSTEVFTWNALCEMEIDLPPLSTQQKYVDIYKAMVANQQCYERGLEDLKLGIDAFIDEIKHKSETTPVRELLKEVDVRNESGEITIAHGINIAKQFMPSVADTNGVDLTKYKLVEKNQFAFSGMQTGRDECIRIALNKAGTPIIISPAYTVFECKNDIVLEEYILMWFSRGESDRRGWFMSDSSIRSNLDLDRFYETRLPIPNKDVQKSIVDIYNVYTERKRINEQLKSQIKNICPILIRGSLEET
ncbi:MAG: restriction endonuclease subunit S [Opitutales bacterium]|nr:restriction endonuclease subunit S [Opitutales bacterium]